MASSARGPTCPALRNWDNPRGHHEMLELFRLDEGYQPALPAWRVKVKAPRDWSTRPPLLTVTPLATPEPLALLLNCRPEVADAVMAMFCSVRFVIVLAPAI